MQLFKCDICGKETIMNDIANPTYIVQLLVNHEILKRDFCKEHFEIFKEQLQPIWMQLENIKSQ